MGRLRLPTRIACAVLLALPASVRAAEVTHIQSAADPGDPMDVEFSIRWDRQQERGLISRESTLDTGGAIVEDLEQLRYSRVANAIVPRLAVGLFRDLELHLEIPYVLADDTTWRYASSVSPATNTIENSCTAQTPTGPCPLFPVGSETTMYHGGKAGDLVAGVSWGILSDARDDTKPFWLVGIDITFPTSPAYDPSTGRDPTTWASPYMNPADPGPLGRKAYLFDFHTALSRRMGPIDPYFTAHVTLSRKNSKTWSNCDAIPSLPSSRQDAGDANCGTWGEDSDADPPWVAGISFGTEIIPFEDRRAGQKVTIDLRFVADYTSDARWFNELTDPVGKLLKTDPYLTMAGRFGLNVHASDYVALQASALVGARTAHWLTGEFAGRVRGDLAPAPEDMNPNYDEWLDAPGNRFRISEVTLFDVSVSGILRF
jgi:hypothetical protein